MLFGIAIVVLAIVIAVVLNKSKISQVVDKAKEAVAPAVAEVKQVVTKVAEVAPENKVISEANKIAVGTVVAAIEAKHAKKRGPKPGNKADTQKTSNNKPKSKK
jgi:hypothetical protein